MSTVQSTEVTPSQAIKFGTPVVVTATAVASFDVLAPVRTISSSISCADAQTDIAQALQEVREIALNIQKPRLAHSTCSEVSRAASELLTVVSQLSFILNTNELHSKSLKAVQFLQNLVDNTKILVAKSSGQLRLGMPALTTALQSACEVLYNLASNIAPTPDDSTGTIHFH